jgi:hypothetical protein
MKSVEITEQTEITEKTEKSPKTFRLFRYFRLFRNLKVHFIRAVPNSPTGSRMSALPARLG